MQAAACDKGAYVGDLTKLLRKVEVFSTLRFDQLQSLRDGMTEMRLAAGETLFKQGDTGDEFFIITEGRVAVRDEEAAAHHQERKTLKILKKGDYFGEMALLASDARRNCSCVVARGPVKMLIMAKADFEKLLGPVAPWLDSATALRVFEVTPALRALPAREDNNLRTQSHSDCDLGC